ncbi:hypothetical protein BRD56_04605, partial [Thermoplasmatales archaeon SW_10_69_26]
WATVIELALALPTGLALIGTQQRREGSAWRAARISRFNATLVTGSALWLGLLTATLLGWV